MVKISKNAKKILALTLAGVMTVGTVVPGSALSTVENVQAYYDEDSISTEVKTAYDEVVNALNTLYADQQAVYGTKFGISNIENAVKEEIKEIVDLEKVNVKVTDVPTAAIKTNYVSVTITVENASNTMDGKSGTYNIPVSIINASTVKDMVGTIDVSSVKPSFDNTVGPVAKEVNAIVSEALADAVKDSIADGKFKVETTCVRDELDEVATFTVTSKIINIAESKDEAKYEFKFTANKTDAEKTDADVAADILAANLKNVEVPAGTDLSVGSKEEAIDTAIKTEAEKLLKENGYTTLNNKVATVEIGNVQGLLSNATWKNEVTVKVTNADGTNPRTAKVVLNVKVSEKEASKNVVTKLEVVSPKKEVEVGSDLTGTKIKVYLENKSPVTVDFDDATYFTYDQLAWDTSKLGTTSVTFTSKDNSIPVSVTYTAKVVNTEEYTTGNKLDKFVNTGRLANVSSVSSSDSSVVEASYDKKNNKLTLKAISSGKAKITVKENNGVTYENTVTVDKKGEITPEDQYTQVKQVDRFIMNKPSSIGFVAHPENSTNKVYVTNQELADYSKDAVAKATFDTVDGESVIRVTPVSQGTADIVVIGGDNGKLKYTISVSVNADNTLSFVPGSNKLTDITGKDISNTAITLNKSAVEKIQNLTLTPTTKVTVDSIGFDSNDKFSYGGVDTVPASDAEKVELVLDTTGNKVDKVNVYHNSRAGKEAFAEVSILNSGIDYVENTTSNLGFVATAVGEIKNNPAGDKLVDVSFTKDSNGKNVIKIAPVSKTANGTATITVKADSDSSVKAVITAKVKNGVVSATVTEEFKLNGKWNFTAPTTTVYELGDTINLTGGYFEADTAGTDGKKEKIALTNDMVDVTKFTESTVGTDGKVEKDKKIVVNYGGQKAEFKVAVKPATKTVSVNSLGLDSDEKVASVAVSGDTTIGATFDSKKENVVITANKVDQKGTAIVTTNKGNKVAIKITVDENGNITTSLAKDFQSSISTVDNTVANLGIIAKEAVSANESVVTATVAGEKIILTSVNPGTTTVTVKDGDKTATINVTVDEFGTISTQIQKYGVYTPGWHAAENGGWFWVEEDGTIKENGWVDDNGVRYYIENGVTVYNTWKFFESEGVWRYFNKWGANVENGWYWVGKFCYFFRDGQMVENEWIKTNGIWSYVDKYGHALQNGWFKIDGYYYCFDKYGNMYADTYVGKYYVNKWGAWDSRYDKK